MNDTTKPLLFMFTRREMFSMVFNGLNTIVFSLIIFIQYQKYVIVLANILDEYLYFACICVCVCVRGCLCLCVCFSSSFSLSLSAYVYICVRIYIYIYIYIYVCVCVCVSLLKCFSTGNVLTTKSILPNFSFCTLHYFVSKIL